MRRVTQAWRAAEDVLLQHKVRRAPVNVRRIAGTYAQVIERVLDRDISGALVPLGGSHWVIVVNSLHHPNRKRFTVAHELGHLILHRYKTPHADRGFRLRDARSSEGSVLEEIQANQFAAELLMPRSMLMRALEDTDLEHAPANEDQDDNFERIVHQLSGHFRVSRQAMAVRLSSLLA